MERFGAESNKFTSVSVRGPSIMDYTLVPIDLFFLNFSQFYINYMTNIVAELDILVDKSIFDHSILYWS